MQQAPKLSIILPAKNEADSLLQLLPRLCQTFPDAEIIVVDDGSTDDTQALCEQYQVRCIRHMYSMGNGAAIKSGARAAGGQWLAFMDADSQHDPEDLHRLLKMLQHGYDMVVGTRDFKGHASRARWLANSIYNRLSSWISGHPIPDLTSGFRVARAAVFKRIIYMLPNGFSYPTTSTMAFLRSGHCVGFAPITVSARVGSSHIRPVRDGLRFLIIIFRVGTLYSPLKLFLPMSGVFFALGASNYLYTYLTQARFTNMSLMLFSISVLAFLFGMLSEQLTNMLYSPLATGASDDDSADPGPID